MARVSTGEVYLALSTLQAGRRRVRSPFSPASSTAPLPASRRSSGTGFVIPVIGSSRPVNRPRGSLVDRGERRLAMNRRASRPLLLAAASLASLLAGLPAEAARVTVRVAPPAARVEVRGVAPSPRHVWVGGYWSWSGSAHVWVAGKWSLPPRGRARWVEGHWKHVPAGWVWVPGHWA
ncbi:MAG: hypothetical protein EDX89_14040 [Acidobacteria bacterium]|nr:MAG: hypothetical protein EDX89_14040 [Acidobacteriota bacterium]MCE7959142.1 hypothetical protein [Acidobacteria bacterium ACB2]